MYLSVLLNLEVLGVWVLLYNPCKLGHACTSREQSSYTASSAFCTLASFSERDKAINDAASTSHELKYG